MSGTLPERGIVFGADGPRGVADRLDDEGRGLGIAVGGQSQQGLGDGHLDGAVDFGSLHRVRALIGQQGRQRLGDRRRPGRARGVAHALPVGGEPSPLDGDLFASFFTQCRKNTATAARIPASPNRSRMSTRTLNQ